MARVHRGTFSARKPREGARRTMPTKVVEIDGQPETVLICGKGDYVRKGESYLFFAVGFRGARQYRCTSHYPKGSELDGSKFATVLAAQEDAAASLAAIDRGGDPDEIRGEVDSIIESVREAVTEVADEYGDAAEAMGGSYGAGAQMEEWKENLENANIHQWQASDFSDEPESCDNHDDREDDCEACSEKLAEWVDNLIDEAQSQIDDISRD